MEEMRHQDRLAATLSDAFHMLAAEMDKRMSRRSDIYALFDSDGSYMIHHAPKPKLSGSAVPQPPITAETFLAAPFLSAFAASSRDRSFRSATFFLTGSPETELLRWAALPVISDDNQLMAYLVSITAASVSEEEIAVWMQFAGIAFTAFVREADAKASSRALQGNLEKLRDRSLRKEALYAKAMKIHAGNNADQVLIELMNVLMQHVPDRSFVIYLSHDQHRSVGSVKPLHFLQSDDDMKFRAFTEGKLVVGPNETGSREAVFPLRGKQGVYGVVCMSVHDGEDADCETIYDITMLADTAGSAFENAKLYEQSNVLVGELRLINEITQRLNQSLKLQNIFQFASSELRSIFNAEFSCILELDNEKDELIVQASEPASFFGNRYSLQCGFAGRVVKTKEPIIVSDYNAEHYIRSVWMESTQSRSMIASPIIVEGNVEGVMLVTHRSANFFSYDNFKLLQTLSAHIGLAVTNASLHAEVRKMVQIDRLTGLFARHFLDDQIGVFQKKDYCGSLVVVDIDNFKKINDTYGHQIGDRVLIQVSSIVRSCIREGDIASRWGGEELAVYLSQVTKEQATNIAERIRRRVEAETSPKVTVSCGVSDWNWEDEKISVESLFYRADMALYKAKHSGKNQICIG